MRTTWVTFYSYKGGVGRTMALANVAGRLAREGRRVLMIDFDLEAPGLDSFKEFSSAEKQGVVEYIHQILEDKKAPPIGNFVHLCPVSDNLPGKLWLMPSGRKDDRYADRLHHINWTELYETKLAQPLIANWKAAIERTFEPDYVFIDSRTGLTDVGGVCTLHFPDIVVLFFALNDQNIEGTSAVLRTISQASATRPIEVLTVASPIPNLTRDSSLLGPRLAKAESKLGGPITATIGYFAPMVLEERVWTLNESSVVSGILPAYEALATNITKRARDGIDFFLARGEEILKQGAIEDAPQIAEALFSQYGDRLKALKMAGQLMRIQGKRDETAVIALKILAQDPTDIEGFNWIVNHLQATRNNEQLRTLLRDVYSRIELSVDAAKVIVLTEMGHVYMQLKEHQTAALCYVRSLGCIPPGNYSVAVNFNYLEAKRRAIHAVDDHDHALWSALAIEAGKLLENVLRLQNDRQHAITSANTLQALAGVFAIVGQRGRARDLLLRAEILARVLNPVVRIFSVIDYEYVERDRFLAQNTEILTALQRGELFDGMKL